MQFLRVKRVGQSLRIRECVSDSVIHRRQARGVGVAKPSHLHRRGLARKNWQAIGVGVPSEINQNVHAISANHGGNVCV